MHIDYMHLWRVFPGSWPQPISGKCRGVAVQRTHRRLARNAAPAKGCKPATREV
jgi:hypothetical protein